MKRSKEEIIKEIIKELAKLEKARQAASRKEARCIQRLGKLQQELKEANEVMQSLESILRLEKFQKELKDANEAVQRLKKLKQMLTKKRKEVMP